MRHYRKSQPAVWFLALLGIGVTLRCALAEGPGQKAPESFPASALLAACTHPAKGGSPKDQDIAEQKCISYLQGITDGMFIMELTTRQSIPTCMPQDASIEVPEARRIFEKFLSERPAQSERSAGLIVAFALMDAYKCGH